uniref:Acylglycerol kinase, mitochondrial n=1 Tax=Parasteatoda tepidariorum TaxID=114398 RepID=A0A2L2Y664_PARTP
MAKLIEFAKTLRRHWKKSTFFFGVLAYGSSYGFDRYKTFQMMRAYCEEAKEYGEKPLQQMSKPKHVTVILNPEANYKKANIQFEKFVAPLLHLAGFKVSVFQTEFSKQAGKLMEIMSNTDAVIVAGGDGTLHEVVTGLMSRSNEEEEQYPLGVVPLGKTNTVAKYLFGSKSSSSAQLMAEATMAVIRENTVALDVLKIQYEGEEKPVFALCQFEQGAFSDVEPLVEKYWYLGSLKDKFTYFKNAFKSKSVIENHSLEYVAPCEGCSRCKLGKQKKSIQEPGSTRWWGAFIPRSNSNKVSNPEKDWSKITNEECGDHLILKPDYLNISSSTATTGTKKDDSSGIMWIKIYPDNLSMMDFITAGLSNRKSKLEDPKDVSQIIKASQLIIDSPEKEEDRFSYIDNEKYPRGSCKISILPKQVIVYG